MHYLEKLATNPYYKMTSKQLKRLEELRQSQQEENEYASTKIPKADSLIPKHQLRLKKKDEPADRNTLPPQVSE